MKRNTPEESVPQHVELPEDVWPRIVSFTTICRLIRASFPYAFVLQFVSKALYGMVNKYLEEHAERHVFRERIINGRMSKKPLPSVCDPIIYLDQYMESGYIHLVWWLLDLKILPEKSSDWLFFFSNRQYSLHDKPFWFNAGKLGDNVVLNWLETYGPPRYLMHMIQIIDGAIDGDHAHIIGWTLGKSVGKNEYFLHSVPYGTMESWLSRACELGHVKILEQLVTAVLLGDNSIHHATAKSELEWYVITATANRVAIKTYFIPFKCLSIAIENNRVAVLEFFKKHGVTLQSCARDDQLQRIVDWTGLAGHCWTPNPSPCLYPKGEEVVRWLDESLGLSNDHQ